MLKSKAFDTILVVVDLLSKYAHSIGLKHLYTAFSVADIFIKNVMKLHVIPQSVISDRDKVFISHFWCQLFRLQRTQLKRSTTYHPQSDGQLQVVNQCQETYLRCFALEEPHTWTCWLPWRNINTTLHSIPLLVVPPFVPCMAEIRHTSSTTTLAIHCFPSSQTIRGPWRHLR